MGFPLGTLNHPDQEVWQDHSLKHLAVTPSLDPYE